MRQFIENQLGITLVLACLLGLVFPFGQHISGYVIITLLAAVTFLSCYKINLSGGSIISFPPIAFCIGRYAILPLILWYFAHVLIPEYSLAVLLITLLPAGVSSPAFTSLFNGNVTLAFIVTFISSAMCLMLIPIYISTIEYNGVSIDPIPLFRTLALCILLPICLHSFLRESTRIKKYNQLHGRFTSVLLIAAIIFIVIAKERHEILHDATAFILPAVIALVCFSIFLLVSFSFKATASNRIAYVICSTFNNAALGVSVAVIHFETKVVLATVAAELMWALLPIFVQPLIKRSFWQ